MREERPPAPGPRGCAASAGDVPPAGEPMAATASNARRKIYLVQPKFPPSYWGQEHFLKLTHYGAVYPPLGLLTLAALTPPEYEVSLVDESAGERVDFNTDADIICVTGYLFQKAHVF